MTSNTILLHSDARVGVLHLTNVQIISLNDSSWPFFRILCFENSLSVDPSVHSSGTPNNHYHQQFQNPCFWSFREDGGPKQHEIVALVEKQRVNKDRNLIALQNIQHQTDFTTKLC